MDNRELTQESIGWFAFILSLYFFINPALSFYKLIKGKIPLDQTPIYFVTTFFISCLCWYLYSDMLHFTHHKMEKAVPGRCFPSSVSDQTMKRGS